MEQPASQVEINENLQNALGELSTQLRSTPLLNAYRKLDWGSAPMLRLFLTQMNSYWHWGSLTDLGKCYYYGNLVSEDDQKALEFYQEASEGGDDSACFELADYYYFTNEYMKAIEEYQHCLTLTDEFTEDGLGLINARLGDSYSKLASPDLHNACKYLQIGAEKYKNGFAARRLWQIYLDEDPQHLNVQTILNYMQLGANVGDACSIDALARNYMFGESKLHLKMDIPKAEKILLDGEHVDDPQIYADLGFLYLHAPKDSGVVTDTMKAITYFEKANSMDPENGFYHSELGYAYWLRSAYSKAEPHLLTAYDKGFYKYADCLGTIYKEGTDGVKRDYARSAIFFKIAMEKNQLSGVMALWYVDVLDELGQYDEEWSVNEHYLKQTNDIGFAYRKSAMILSGKSNKETVETALKLAEAALEYDAVKGPMSFVLANYYVEHAGNEQKFDSFQKHKSYEMGNYYAERAATKEGSYEKAQTYYEIAFKAGIVDAAVYIGRLHERKLIPGATIDSAYMWYKKAADAGSARGKAEIQCFQKVPVDPFGLIIRMRRVKKAASEF